MRALAPRRGPLRRFVAALTLAAVAVSLTGCAAYRWRAIPVTDLSLADERIAERDVRLETDSGTVNMTVSALAHPYVSGWVKRGNGVVEVYIGAPSEVEIGTLDASNALVWTPTRVSAETARLDSGGLLGKPLRVRASSGEVTVRHVSRVDWPWAEGRLGKCDGKVRVDLRRVRALEVHELDGGMTVVKTLGVAVGVALIAAVIVAATKESCPFVYVDRGQGWELVGEAYAGAAFRSTRRDDLLPLPDVGDARSLRVRLRNEARETQYTDRAELVVVDHGTDVRVLSTFDGQPVVVGPSRAPSSARDGRGREVAALVSARDEWLWETDPNAVAATSDDSMQELLTAQFDVARGGPPVLELVAGNTMWLDLVFGRFFAAMGPRLGGYIAQGNDSAAGPRIRRWREREGVDLVVEMLMGGRWRQVAVVPTVGPIALREIAIPLPPDPAAAPGRVTVRVRGGLGFWRIERLALSTRAAAPLTIRSVKPHVALGTAGRNELDAVLAADGHYQTLGEMNESLELDFDLPERIEGRGRTTFLLTTGYYNVHQPVQSRWLPGTLKAIRDEPGSLSRFGRDLARQYLKAQGPATAAAFTGRSGR